MIPCNTWSTRMYATVMVDVNTRRASASDWSIDSTCVTSRMRCRSHRSTHTPAIGASSSVGICPQKPTTPRRSTDPVSRYTSQLVATRVIHVPTSETLCPPKKRRKLRLRSARVMRGPVVREAIRSAQRGDHIGRGPHASDRREEVRDRMGMKHLSASGHGVFHENLVVAALVRCTCGALDARVGGDAAEHDRADAATPKVHVEVGTVECVRLMLHDHNVGRLAAELLAE